MTNTTEIQKCEDMLKNGNLKQLEKRAIAYYLESLKGGKKNE